MLCAGQQKITLAKYTAAAEEEEEEEDIGHCDKKGGIM